MKMDSIIREYTEYNEPEVLRLYESVGWTNYTANPAMLKKAYEHSLRTYAAYAGSRLAGLIRIVGDGFSVVFIQDLLVHPHYQRMGIGTALMQTVLREYGDVYQIHLLTENTERSIRFYQSLGFTMDTDMECRAFSRYHTV